MLLIVHLVGRIGREQRGKKGEEGGRKMEIWLGAH